MATESPLLHDGAQNTLSTAGDARRSSITGTTLLGPNGSGQYLCVVQSTSVDRTVAIASTAPTAVVGNNQVYGVLQNTPGPGTAADVGIFGITKVVAATTTVTRGGILIPSTLSAGCVTVAGSTGPFAYNPIGWSLEAATTTFTVITAFISPMFKGSTT